jgi:alanyl-tRNA synthetase
VTERLHYADTYLLEFDATVVAHARFGDRASVVLDRSAFYPESGGQMADRGTLGGVPILDVQLDDAGVLHHVIDGSLDVGASVHGSIDGTRRRTFAALHTAQHVLSRALVDVARAETVSARLGETIATIDVKEAVSDARVSECERIVNELVDADRSVRAWFPSNEELASLDLRRAPKQSENIRVVEVAGFDVTPCGGTHVSHTAQLGPVRVASSERYKGGTRVSFHAGPRARATLFAEDDALRALARTLACPVDGVVSGVDRLRADITRAQGDAGRLRGALAIRIAADARRSNEARLVVTLSDGGIELAQKVATELAEGTRVAIVTVSTDEGTHVVVARGAESTENAGAIVKAITSAAGGKGGGRPERAEGRLPLGADVDRALAAAT